MITYLFDRKSGAKTNVNGVSFKVNGSQVVVIQSARSEVEFIVRQGGALVIKFKSGEIITIQDYFITLENELVFDDLSGQDGGLYWVDGANIGSDWAHIDSLDALLLQETSTEIAWGPLALGAGLIGAGGIAISNSGGDNDDNYHYNDNISTPHVRSPKVTINNGTNLAGTGMANTTIILTKPDGSTVTIVVDKNGNWSLGSNPLGDGERGTLVTVTGDGNKSAATDTGIADKSTMDPIVGKNTAQQLAGEAEPGATIILKLPDGSSVGTTADKDGHWKFANPNPLGEGDEGKLTARDAAGNESGEVVIVGGDQTPPKKPTVDVNNGKELTGQGEPGSEVIIKDDKGNEIDRVTVDKDGNWKFEPNPLDEGDKGELIAKDSSGNESDPVTIIGGDQTPPKKPTVDVNNGKELTGQGEPGSEVIIKDDKGNEIDRVTVDKDGNWKFEPNPLDEGDKGELIAKDSSGNESDPVTIIGGDQTPPKKPTVDVNNGKELTGQGEPGSEVIIKDDKGNEIDRVTVDKDGKWTFEPNPLDEGDKGQLTAKDAAGNESDPINIVGLDTTPPKAPTVEVISNEVLSGKGEVGATITLKDADGKTIGSAIADKDGNWSISPNPLADGAKGSVTAKDATGNESKGTNIVGKDTTAPESPTVEVISNEVLSGKGEVGATITLKDADGKTIGSAIADKDGNWSISPNPLADGAKGSVTAKDATGNESKGTNIVGKDTTAPESPTVEVISNEVLSGKGEVGATITLKDADGKTIGSAIADKDGNWSISPNPLADGAKGSVTAKDATGNESKGTNIVGKDTTAPESPTVEVISNEVLSGKGEVGATITLKDADGKTIGSAIADKDGNWSISPNPLADGAKGSVTAKDATGNESKGTEIVGKDTTAPESPTVEVISNEVLSGKGEVGATITLKDADGKTIGSAIADKDGNWSISPNPLADGAKGSVTAKDATGNESKGTNIVGKDTTAPESPTVEVISNEVLSGKGEVGATITLKDADGKTIGSAIADKDGNWSISPNPLADGAKGSVTAKDATGNESKGTNIVGKDTTAPESPTVEVISNEVLSGKGEVGATITLKDADGKTIGSAIADKDGNWSISPNPLADGAKGSVTAKDATGNESKGTEIVGKDTTAPESPTVEVISNEVLSGKGEVGATITLKDADGKTIGSAIADKDGNWSISPNPLADGAKGSVTAKDATGNESKGTNIVGKDTTAPESPTVEVISNEVLSGKGEVGATITLKDADGKTIGSAIADKDGNWSISPNPLADGAKGSVTAKDATGNESKGTNIVGKDTTAPESPTVEVISNEVLSGKGEVGATITLKDADGKTIGSAIADKDGNWSISPNPLADGAKGSVTAKDATGNESKGTNIVGKDTTAPESPTVEVISNEVLSGKGEVGATITLKDADGKTIGSAIADKDGNWSISPNPLADGAKGSVTAKDATGNESKGTNIVGKDTTAPESPTVEVISNEVLSGKGEVGATITLKDADGKTIGSAIADKDGNWSISPNPLADGAKGSVTAKDATGNESKGTNIVGKDTTAPESPTVEVISNEVLSGKGEVGATITLKDADGKTIGSAIADKDGNWSISPNPLADGAKGSVTAKDATGNESKGTNIVGKDTTAPESPTVEVISNEVLSGKGEVGATITLKDADGKTIGSAIADKDGNWSISPNPLADGAKGSVTAKDATGNESKGTNIVGKDTTAPESPTVEVISNEVLSGKGEVGATITLKDADGKTIGSAIADKDGNWSISPNPLADGAKGSVTAKDATGNESKGTNIVGKDTTAPESPTVEVISNEVLSGKGEVGATITLKDADGKTIGSAIADKDGNWSISPNPLADGAKGSVTAKDATGNESKGTNIVGKDTTAPESPTVEVISNEVLSGKGEVGATITLKDADGKTIGSAIADKDGNWSISPNPLADGAKGSVTAKDATGNESKGTNIVGKDTTAPESPTVEVISNEVLSGKGEVGATITLKDADGKTIGSAIADKDGNWSISPNPLADGAKGSVTAKDATGNESKGTNIVGKDTTAPESPTVEVISNEVLSGKGEVGATITLKDADGKTIGSAIADKDGNWSISPNPLADGAKGSVTAKDATGNESKGTNIVGKDTTAPESPTVEVISNEVLSGKGEVGATITLKDADGKTIGSAIADKDGNWSISPNPLADGAKGSVTAKDATGNESKGTNIVGKDTTAPESPTVEVISNEVLSGKGEVGATITLKDADGKTIGSAIADKDGNWSISPNPLADGAKGSVTAKDATGNESKGTEIVGKDTTAPESPTVEVISNEVLSGKGEVGATITLKDADGKTIGSAIADKDGNWSISPNPLADGAKGSVTAKDATGNESKGTNIVGKDTTAPEAPAVDVNNATDLSGTGESGATITLTKPDGTIIDTTIVDDKGHWSFGENPLKHGEEGNITATDAASNTSDSTPTGIADKEAPDAPTVDINGPILSGTGEIGATITLTKPDGKEVATEVGADGKWTFDPNPMGDGEKGSVTATDPSGNTSVSTPTGETDKSAPNAPTIDVIVDNVAPITDNIANNGHTNDQTPTLKGTAEKNSVVTICYKNEDGSLTKIGVAKANAEGHWEFTTSDLLDGNYTFVAVAKDAAGNKSVPSDDFTINIDTSQPAKNTITIDSISDDTGISNSDFETNDNTLIFNGSLSSELKNNEKVEISLDGGTTWINANVNGTHWTYDHRNTILKDGSYNVQARVSTLAGNASKSVNQIIKVDTEAVDLQGLTTTVKISTDTSHGLEANDGFSHSSSKTNDDLITRDQTLTLSGNLSAGLASDNYLQISADGGKTWETLVLTGLDWKYSLQEFTSSTTITYNFRVIDTAGNVAINTNFKDEGYTVVVDLDSPDGISTAPVIPDNANTSSAYDFTSATYGKVEAGAIVSLVLDVNKNGSYQEGIDKIISYATADADGNWSINAKLPSGSNQLGFVVWDQAGNHSGLSPVAPSAPKDIEHGYSVIKQTWGNAHAGSDGANVAAFTLQNGNWSLYQSTNGKSNIGSIYNMIDSSNGKINVEEKKLDQFNPASGGGYGNFNASANIIDIDRDGYADVIAMKSGYSWPHPIWMQTSEGKYVGSGLAYSSATHLGGLVAFDLTGDGYADFATADSSNDSLTFLINEQGTLRSISSNRGSSVNEIGLSGFVLQHDVSGVDLNNDGAVDIVGHSGTSDGFSQSNNTELITLLNNGDGTMKVGQKEAGIMPPDGGTDDGGAMRSMVWADFNGDGYLDLFFSVTATDNESRIFLNDGTGKLKLSDNDTLKFGDTVEGGASLAVDWNHDGKMDIIEVPRSDVGGNPVIYLNKGNNVWNTAEQKITLGVTGHFVGAMSVDYNWDGNKDLILYNANGTTTVVKNNDVIKDGTALHVRIVDGQGISAFWGNTVHLYNSEGKLVATQILNPQSTGTNDSSGLLSFYGLDPNETYSIQMLRIKDKVANHVGADPTKNGTINSTWGGLKAGEAHDAFILTAENDKDVNHSIKEIAGTGYNDTFFATEGNDVYNGGGGWNHSLTGEKVWSAQGGLDIVDYSNATKGIVADLTAGTATGMGDDKLINIEGLVGSDFDDVFTNSTANNVFEGKGGNDKFHLTHTGNDVLLYRLLDSADATGGNGHDTVTGFHVGKIIADKDNDKDADVINISELLDYDGVVSFYTDEGKTKLDYNSKGILDYLKVETVNGNTVVSIDRDGKGSDHDFSTVVTLENTTVDLLTLLANNQIII